MIFVTDHLPMVCSFPLYNIFSCSFIIYSVSVHGDKYRIQIVTLKFWQLLLYIFFVAGSSSSVLSINRLMIIATFSNLRVICPFTTLSALIFFSENHISTRPGTAVISRNSSYTFHYVSKRASAIHSIFHTVVVLPVHELRLHYPIVFHSWPYRCYLCWYQSPLLLSAYKFSLY